MWCTHVSVTSEAVVVDTTVVVETLVVVLGSGVIVLVAVDLKMTGNGTVRV